MADRGVRNRVDLRCHDSNHFGVRSAKIFPSIITCINSVRSIRSIDFQFVLSHVWPEQWAGKWRCSSVTQSSNRHECRKQTLQNNHFLESLPSRIQFMLLLATWDVKQGPGFMLVSITARDACPAFTIILTPLSP
jgi:hypothetical protein